MGRPPKKKVEEQVISQEDILKENQELKEQLKQLMKRLDAQINEPKVAAVAIEDDESVPEIPLNKTVKVMSLFHGGLNLKTSEDATAQVFRFEHVGQVFSIIYADLVKIIGNQRRFFEEGYCMILDKNVVKAHYLEEPYKKFINAKVIGEILDYDVAKMTDVFSSTTKVIQQTIVDIVINKMLNNEYVDKNKVDALSRAYGKDIFDLVNKMR